VAVLLSSLLPTVWDAAGLPVVLGVSQFVIYVEINCTSCRIDAVFERSVLVTIVVFR